MQKRKSKPAIMYFVSFLWLGIALILYFKKHYYFAGILFLFSVVLSILNCRKSKITVFMNKLTLNISHFIGLITTKIVLSFMYYIVLTPIGIIKNKFASNKNECNAGCETYWKKTDEYSMDYKKQY